MSAVIIIKSIPVTSHKSDVQNFLLDVFIYKKFTLTPYCSL